MTTTAAGAQEPPVLTVRDASLRYPGAATLAIDGLSLVAHGGEAIAIVGRSGSGKSTLARLVTGQLRPTTGTVVVGGLDTVRTAPQVVAGVAGLVYQNPDHQLFARSVADELRLGPSNVGVPRAQTEERVRQVATALGLDAVLEAHPAGLSMALRKRVAVAAVLTMQPRLLVIDEPSAGRDGAGATWVGDVARDCTAAGTTVVVVSHDLALVAAIASRVVVLAHGRLVADGWPGAVLGDERVLDGAGLDPPAVARLALALDPERRSDLPLTLDGLEAAVHAGLGGGGRP